MNFKELKDRIEKAKAWLSSEFLSIQTGRATPAILDSVKVDSYGTKVPINQVASLGSEGPRTLRVAPYDTSQIEVIEKAIRDADLGVSVSADEKGVRVNFPELTSEKREALLKVIKSKHEEARVSLRQARDETWSQIQESEKNGEIGEDEKFRLKDEMEKIVSGANEELDQMSAKKEADIKA